MGWYIGLKQKSQRYGWGLLVNQEKKMPSLLTNLCLTKVVFASLI